MRDNEPKPSASTDLVERAKQILWPGSQHYCQIENPASFPRVITRAQGPYVWDASGTRYIDLFLGSGPVILGHDIEPEVAGGPDLTGTRSVSLRNHAEVVLAEKLCSLIPFVARVAYFKTGSEALHFTVRQILRERDRDAILSVGYHGWLPPWDGGRLDGDFTMVEAESNPEAVLQAITDHGDDLAAIVLEPDFGLLDPDFYAEVEDLAEQYDIDLVVDEVKSGFRLDFPCVSVEAGISPDFLILSKAIGNGAPLSVVCAGQAVADEYNLQGIHSTFAAEAGAIADAYRTVRALEAGAYTEYEAVSRRFYELLTDIPGPDEQFVEGRPTFFRLNADAVDTTAVADSLLDQGVLIHPHDQLLFSATHNRPEVLDTVESALRDCPVLPL